MKNLREIKGRKYILTIMMSVMLSCITVFASSNVSYEEGKEEEMTMTVQGELTALTSQLDALETQVSDLQTQLEDIKELNSKTYIAQKQVNVFKYANSESQILGTFNAGSVIRANIISEDKQWIETEQGFVSIKDVKQLDTARNEDYFNIKKEEIIETVPEVQKPTSQPNTTTQSNKPVQQVETKPVSYNLSVKGKSGLTKEDLDYILAGSPMKNCAKEVLQVEEKYNVNAFFTISVAQAETQRGLTGTGKSKNNAFGITSKSGGYRTFNNLGESVIEFGGMIERVYFSRGLDTVEKIHTLYTSSPNWSTNVKKIMNNTLTKIKQK